MPEEHKTRSTFRGRRFAYQVLHQLLKQRGGSPSGGLHAAHPALSQHMLCVLYGGQIRDFLYVKDAARMTVQFLENDAGGIFNIGSGKKTTWNELAESIFSALKVKGHIEYIPMPDDLIGKYQNFTLADMSRTKEALSTYEEPMSIEKSVEDYIQNYLLPYKTW